MRAIVNIVIECDNAAFADDPTGTVHDLLTDTVKRIVMRGADLTGDDGTIRDTNGNRVGAWTLRTEIE